MRADQERRMLYAKTLVGSPCLYVSIRGINSDAQLAMR